MDSSKIPHLREDGQQTKEIPANSCFQHYSQLLYYYTSWYNHQDTDEKIKYGPLLSELWSAVCQTKLLKPSYKLVRKMDRICEIPSLLTLENYPTSEL